MSGDDSYGTVLRERLKESMEIPANTTVKFVRMNVRQKQETVKPPTFWQLHNEEIGMLCWMVAIFIGGVTFWLSLDSTLKWFR